MFGTILMAFGIGAAMRFGCDFKDDFPVIKEKVCEATRESVAKLNEKLNKKDDK